MSVSILEGQNRLKYVMNGGKDNSSAVFIEEEEDHGIWAIVGRKWRKNGGMYEVRCRPLTVLLARRRLRNTMIHPITWISYPHCCQKKNSVRYWSVSLSFKKKKKKGSGHLPGWLPNPP